MSTVILTTHVDVSEESHEGRLPLAEDIESAQEPEVQTMRHWLEDWGRKRRLAPWITVTRGHGSEEMPGMMHEAQMEGLLSTTEGPSTRCSSA